MVTKRVYAYTPVRTVAKKRKVPAIRKSPLLKVQQVVLRYHQRDALDPAAGGVVAGRIYRANGMFDPEFTGAGHQPRGFDQLMALYDHFVVVKSKITVRFCWAAESDAVVNVPVDVGVCLVNGTTLLLGDNFSYQEDGYSNFKLLTPNESNEIVITNTFNNGFLGKKTWQGDDELEGSVTADPAEQAFYHIFASPLTTQDAPSIAMSVQIEYTAMLIEPSLPGAS